MLIDDNTLNTDEPYKCGILRTTLSDVKKLEDLLAPRAQLDTAISTARQEASEEALSDVNEYELAALQV